MIPEAKFPKLKKNEDFAREERPKQTLLTKCKDKSDALSVVPSLSKFSKTYRWVKMQRKCADRS